MKKYRLGLLLGAVTCGVSLISTNVSYASTSNFQTRVNKIDNPISDSLPAVELPDGGFLFGPGTFKSEDGKGNVSIIDPNDTDLKVTTVGQAKKDEGIVNNSQLGELFSTFVALPSPGTSRGSVATQNYTLKANQGYSEGMQGTGWRYAKYLFKPAAGTGDYLQWRDYGDSGIVERAENVKVHNGYALYPGQSIWATAHTGSGALLGTTFSSINPIPGSYYYVLNQ
ncbi:MAG: hypothetical protein ABF754_05370 [Leuconostoc pseudomesenteroides]|nr:hypothetical protein [Leuconostoc pseudomesenteroides]